MREGMRIDLGGFAKGHAVDNAAAILHRRDIRHANVSAGGDSRVIGDRRGRPWTIGIRDRRRAGEMVAVLPLEDVSISPHAGQAADLYPRIRPLLYFFTLLF